MNKYIFCIIVLFILVGCEKHSNPLSTSTDTTKEIMPLKVGNRWIWQVEQYDSVGAVIVSYCDSLVVLRDSTFQSEKWYLLKGAGSILYTNKSDGLYLLQSGYAYHLFLYPAKAGDTYYNPTFTMMKVITIDSLITVPYGAFSCLGYQAYSQNRLDEVWYCSPNIGIIKIDDYYITQGGINYKCAEYNLISVSIN